MCKNKFGIKMAKGESVNDAKSFSALNLELCAAEG